MFNKTIATLLLLIALSCQIVFGQINFTAFPTSPNKGSLLRLEFSIPGAGLLSPTSCLKPNKSNVALVSPDQVSVIKADSVKIISNEKVNAYFKIPDDVKIGNYRAVVGNGTLCEVHTDGTLFISNSKISDFSTGLNLGKGNNATSYRKF